MEFLERISSKIDKEAIVDLTCELIKKRTVNPPGNEYLAKDLIVDSLKQLGARIEILEKESGRPNILGWIGEGKPVIAIIAHLDVVPPGQGWKTDPFFPQVKEGKIYGRGAIDDKGPYAASWGAVKSILSSGLPWRGTIVLGAVSDEERGSEAGMKFLLEEKNFRPSFCMIPDGGKLNEVVLGEKGGVGVKLSTKGKSAHASQPYQGENAIYKMLRFLDPLREFNFEGNHHPLFDALTLNLSKIKGGEVSNVVPDSCEAVLDIRYPLGMSQEGIISQLKSLSSRLGLDVEIGVIFSTEPHLLEEENPLVKAFKQIAKTMGVNLKFGTMGGITLAKNLYFKGIPGVVHSPGRDSVAHQPNEYVEIGDLFFCSKLWAGVIYQILGGRS